jgi:hypothetical protein
VSGAPTAIIDITAGLTGVLDGPLELPDEPISSKLGISTPADSPDGPRGGPPDIQTVASGESVDVSLAVAPPGGASADDTTTPQAFGGGFSLLLSEEEPEVSIEAKAPTASEAGTSSGAFMITLSEAADTELDIDYTVSGSATSGTDYAARASAHY